MNHGIAPWQAEFLRRHALEPGFLLHAQKWFDPLVDTLLMHQKGAGGPLLVAVNGSQGSGKTTLCAYLLARLEALHGLRAVSLSLDDFYLTRAEREALAVDVHPLLRTRGVPGTHDMALLDTTLDALLAPMGTAPVAVPRFDKAVDDRRPHSDWEPVAGPVHIVLLEGWCLGARPQGEAQLVLPVNQLEREEDPDGRWRAWVNDALARDFPALYRRVHYWVMLQAPSFAAVYAWRLEQEQKLRLATGGTGQGLMSEAAIARFIQFYQRLTEHCLAGLPAQVDYLYTLDSGRQITACHERGKVPA
jgi:D-glycerate 3-kinase